jgi:hypothetical protein
LLMLKCFDRELLVNANYILQRINYKANRVFQ